MVVTARRRFPSIAIWQQPDFDTHNFTYPPCCLSRRVCVILYMLLYFVEKKCVEAIHVELVAVPQWPHNFLNCYNQLIGVICGFHFRLLPPEFWLLDSIFLALRTPHSAFIRPFGIGLTTKQFRRKLAHHGQREKQTVSGGSSTADSFLARQSQTPAR
jgi:hypothetical protein